MSKSDSLPFTTTLSVRDSCFCLHARRAARALARRYDDALRPAGINNGQFSLLMSLNRPAPPTMGQVADLLALDRTTLTANLKPLERRGLLVTLPDDADKRSRRLALTDAGREVLIAAVPIWERTQAEVDAALQENGAERFRGDLRALSGHA